MTWHEMGRFLVTTWQDGDANVAVGGIGSLAISRSRPMLSAVSEIQTKDEICVHGST